ncbi:MAG: hypothetical protein MMC33_001241 [Icmadophila ericetorum]|nr:hypothetical protein [Icmadophila ericetorum]
MALHYSSIFRILFVLGGVGILYLVGLGIYNLYFHPLSKFPGPHLWAVSRLPYVRSLVSGRLHLRVTELHEKYGTIVRTAPNELSFIEAPVWHTIYAGQAGNKGFQKNLIISGAQGYHSLITTNDTDHTRLRKLLSSSFSARALARQERLFQDYISRFIGVLRRRALAEGGEKRKDHGGETVVNIVEWFNFFTFDLTGHLTFSESFGCLEEEAYTPWIQMIFGHLRASALMISLRFYSPLDQILEAVARRLLKKWMALKDAFLDLSLQKVHRRLAKKEVPVPDFTSSLLEKTADGGATFEEISGTTTFLIIAGSETGATVLGGGMGYLAKSPHAMQRLREEMARFKHEEEITLKSIEPLPYLTAVINEALRLCTPLPSGLTRIVPKGGAVIAGRHVPEGTFVGVSQYAAYRSPLNFTKPNAFHPERWLPSEASNSEFANDQLSVMQPFFVGNRGCLGQNIAWAEMRLLLARMVWNFDIEKVDDERTVDWDSQESFYLWQKESCEVRLRAWERAGIV